VYVELAVVVREDVVVVRDDVVVRREVVVESVVVREVVVESVVVREVVVVIEGLILTQTKNFGVRPEQSFFRAGFHASKFARVRLIGAAWNLVTILAQVSEVDTYLHPIQFPTWPA